MTWTRFSARTGGVEGVRRALAGRPAQVAQHGRGVVEAVDRDHPRLRAEGMGDGGGDGRLPVPGGPVAPTMTIRPSGPARARARAASWSGRNGTTGGCAVISAPVPAEGNLRGGLKAR
jgi:hypothetical protein